MKKTEVQFGFPQGPRGGVVQAGTDARFAFEMSADLFSLLGTVREQVETITFRRLYLYRTARDLEVIDLTIDGIEALFNDPTFPKKGMSFSVSVARPVPMRKVPVRVGQTVLLTVRNPLKEDRTLIASLKGEVAFAKAPHSRA